MPWHPQWLDINPIYKQMRGYHVGALQWSRRRLVESLRCNWSCSGGSCTPQKDTPSFNLPSVWSSQSIYMSKSTVAFVDGRLKLVKVMLYIYIFYWHLTSSSLQRNALKKNLLHSWLTAEQEVLLQPRFLISLTVILADVKAGQNRAAPVCRWKKKGFFSRTQRTSRLMKCCQGLVSWVARWKLYNGGKKKKKPNNLHRAREPDSNPKLLIHLFHFANHSGR